MSGAPPPAVLVAGYALTLAACARWPLGVYALTLAAFGLAHVLWEFRVVVARYGPPAGAVLRQQVGLLLLAVMGARAAQLAGVLPGGTRQSIELGLLLALVAAPLPLLWRARAPRSAMVAGAAALALAAGAWAAPAGTLLFLAVAHNLTPVGLLADAAAPGQRGRTLVLAAAAFLGGPLLVASGLPGALLGVDPAAGLLPAGPLAAHLGAYLPAAWHAAPWATQAFAGVVFAQCLHYAAVIHLLPAAVGDRPPPRFVVPAVLAGAALFVAFWADFAQARQAYGIVAAAHAWVELPALLLALGGLTTPPRPAPAG